MRPPFYRFASLCQVFYFGFKPYVLIPSDYDFIKPINPLVYVINPPALIDKMGVNVIKSFVNRVYLSHQFLLLIFNLIELRQNHFLEKRSQCFFDFHFFPYD